MNSERSGCSALRGDWNTHMPCGHLRQFGTIGDVFPVHCLACENEQLRAKLREKKEKKRYLRAANKGAERNSIVRQSHKYLPGRWRAIAYEHEQRGEHVASLWCRFLADVREANPPNADFRRGDLNAPNNPQSETPSPARNG